MRIRMIEAAEWPDDTSVLLLSELIHGFEKEPCLQRSYSEHLILTKHMWTFLKSLVLQ